MAAFIDDASEDGDWEENLPLATLLALRGNEVDLLRRIDAMSDGSSEEENEENQTNDKSKYRWVPQGSRINKAPPLPEFDESTIGLNEASTSKATLQRIIDYFHLFFTLDFIGSVTEATNEYAEQHWNQEKRGPWTQVDVPTMFRFFGLCLLIGLVVKHRLKDYWSTKAEIQTPYFTSIMRRDRFLDILRHLNWPMINNAREGVTYTDAQKKANWLYCYFNALAKKVYNPDRDLSIDEAMIAHKGRSSYVQYMPAKPCKWGFKVWCLAEATTGYIIQAIPYYGRVGRAAMKIYEGVILNLTTNAGVLGKFHHIYCDNYFSSVEAFSEMASKYNTFFCGTLRKNRRNLPKNLMVKSLKELNERGTSLFSRSGNLLLVLWKDRKLIHLLSAIHGSGILECSRSMRNKTSGRFERNNIECPAAIKDYSKFMGGVDLADQLCQYYSFGRKSCRWTMKIFFYVLELMKLDSHILYNRVCGTSMPYYDYTLALVSDLLSSSTHLQPALNQHIQDNPNRLTRRCFPHDFGKKSYCKVCYYREKNHLQPKVHQTKFGCNECNAHLCIPRCFKIFHTVREYKTDHIDY